MLKKIVTIIFFSLVTTAAITSFAATKELTEAVATSSTIVGKVISERSEIKTLNKSNVEVEYSATQNKANNEATLPTSGWILLSALIGFVLLSNRWGI